MQGERFQRLTNDLAIAQWAQQIADDELARRRAQELGQQRAGLIHCWRNSSGAPHQFGAHIYTSCTSVTVFFNHGDAIAQALALAGMRHTTAAGRDLTVSEDQATAVIHLLDEVAK
jgi:hypothetical protein